MNIQRIAYLGLGVLMLALGILFYFSGNRFRSHAETATGTVVDFAARSTEDGDNMSCPMLEFTTKSGQSVQAVGDVCNEGTKLGDTFDLYYDPSNPETIQMKNAVSALGIPAFFVAFGLFGLAQGSGLLSRKKVTR